MSCKKDKPSTEENFYYQILSLIEQNSIKKNEINWSGIQEKVKDSINVFRNMEDVYRATRYTLKLVNDRHSKLLTRQLDSCNIQRTMDPLPLMETRIIEGDVGYLLLNNGIDSEDEKWTDFYRVSIRKALLQLDSSSKLSGWIIDLRDNSGGDPSCETLGLSPLFEKPLIGIMCNNRNTFTRVICSNSVMSIGDLKLDTLIFDSKLKNRHKKIAILVGKTTASAAELLASAFRFQNNSKIFGSKTYGATSRLDLIEINNSEKLVVAKLYLATESFCDENKNLLKGGIIPDIECDSTKCIAMAADWIKQPLKR